MAVRPIADDLFTWPAEAPQLIGNSCATCGAVTFPRRTGCGRCGSADIEPRALQSTGTLWSWTSQGFVPKEPFIGELIAGDGPWFVGVVELSGEVRVESLLTGVTADSLEIGMPMRLVIIPFHADASGDEIVTYAFAPADAA
jgi:uncharacterized protein